MEEKLTCLDIVPKIHQLIDNEECFRTVRKMRWPNEVHCVSCNSADVIKHGLDETQRYRQKYRCKNCGVYFDDLTGTIFAGSHHPLRIWILCLYFMGLNLSNLQISKELDLNKDDAHRMCTLLREGIVSKKPEVKLDGEVECDEVYVIAGHKGNPDSVEKKTEKAVETA